MIKNIIGCVVMAVCLWPGRMLGQTLRAWAPGMLDIHHINTSRGNATFFIFPDGTTMLLDAGDKKIPKGKENEYYPLPGDDSLTTGQYLSQYMRAVYPPLAARPLDYLVLTHYHNDHYGQIDSTSEWAASREYQLSGVTEIVDLIGTETIIDRGYSFPVDLSSYYRTDQSFQNYRRFINSIRHHGGDVQVLRAGSNTQIVQRHKPYAFPHFNVRNLKTNDQIWSGRDSSSFRYLFVPPLNPADGFDENSLGLALKFSYGDFDYYTGGDLPGFTHEQDYDMETAIASCVGKVEAMVLNHHGYYDASNTYFLQTLDPLVGIQQAIHDPHFTRSALPRLFNRTLQLFTYQFPHHVNDSVQRQVQDRYNSTRGDVLIRVMPGGKLFHMYTLKFINHQLCQRKHIGPYKCYP